MIKIKRISIICVLTMILSLALSACANKDQETDAPEPTVVPVVDEQEDEVTPSPTPEPPRDLGGIDIKVADWFTTGESEATTAREIDTEVYREELQATYNFNLVQENIGTWAEYQELFITSTMSGDPLADIFIMDPKFVPEPLKQGMLYPISDLPSFNPTDERWNQSVIDLMMQNGKVFGFTEENNSPGLGLFWNKRIFEEVGLDPDLLYDLQAEDAWTWGKMEELSKQLTLDRDGDGITDVYAMTGWSVEFSKAAVFSNGSDYVRFNDDTQKYENNQMADEYLDGIKLGVDFFNKGYLQDAPEGADHKWWVGAFASGQAAMMVGEWYEHPSLQDMEDDWGYCFFPKGPGPNAKMQTMFLGNIRVVPNTLDAQRADDVLFAYTEWVSTPPGYEDEEDDYTYYYTKVRDSRAVEETIAPMVEGQGMRSMVYQVPGLSFRWGGNMDDGGYASISAIEIAERASAEYDSIINDFYTD